MKAPQVIIIALLSLGLVLTAHKHGESSKQNFWHTLINAAITIGLLWWGGFWG